MKHELPDILIEQYALGELDEHTARELEEREGFAERLAALQESNEQILNTYPAGAFAVRIQNRFEQAHRSTTPTRERRVRRAFWALPAMATAAALIAFGAWYFTDRSPVPVNGSQQEITRLKGSEPVLRIYRSGSPQDSEPELLADGGTAQQGDRLQLAYNAGGMPFGVIVSLDGRGTVTLHYPVSISAEPQLVQGGEQQLPYGYQLDDAPRFERFFFVVSEQPFTSASVVQAIRSQADSLMARPDSKPELGDQYVIEEVTLTKGDR